MTEDISRRTLLRNGSAGAVTIGIAGLAGCTSSVPFIGGGDGSGPAVENWLFAPSFSDVLDNEPLEAEYENPSIENSEEQNREFEYVVPERILENETELDTHSPIELGSEFRSRVGVPATETDWVLTQTIEWEFDVTYESWNGERTRQLSAGLPTTFLSGSFDTDGVVDALETWVEDNFADEESLSDKGSQAGFDRYEVGDYAFGVHEESLIQVDASSERYLDPSAALEAAVDARDNGNSVWTDDEDSEKLLSLIESGDSVNGRLFRPFRADEYLDDPTDEQTEQFEDDVEEWRIGLTGSGSTREIDGETTDFTQVFLYESEDDIDTNSFEEYVRRNRNYGEIYEFIEDYSIENDGRALILTGTMRSRAAFDDDQA